MGYYYQPNRGANTYTSVIMKLNNANGQYTVSRNFGVSTTHTCMPEALEYNRA